jgi:hypothetical protein
MSFVYDYNTSTGSPRWWEIRIGGSGVTNGDAGGGTGRSTYVAGGSGMSRGIRPTVWIPPTARPFPLVVETIFVSPTGDPTFPSHQVGGGHRKNALGRRSYGSRSQYMALGNNTLSATREPDSTSTALPL